MPDPNYSGNDSVDDSGDEEEVHVRSDSDSDSDSSPAPSLASSLENIYDSLELDIGDKNVDSSTAVDPGKLKVRLPS